MRALKLSPNRTPYDFRSEFCLKTRLQKTNYAGDIYRLGFNLNRLDSIKNFEIFEKSFIKSTRCLELSDVTVIQDHALLIEHRNPDKHVGINNKDLNQYSY